MAPVLRWTEAGRVGIGTGSAASAVGAGLHVISNVALAAMQVESAHNVGTWFNLRNTDTRGRMWNFISTGSNNGEGPGQLLIRDASKLAVRLLIDTVGRVGIGTSAPKRRLHVAGSLRVDTLAGTGTRMVVAAANGDVSTQALPAGDNLGNHIATQNVRLDDNWLSNDGGNEGLRVDDAGNVGIGTSSPDNKLDVNGKISVTQSVGDEMVIINADNWTHSSGNQVFGIGGDHFVMASREGSVESAGIYGDGNTLTLWSPGDAAPGQPTALLYLLDEDRFDGDTNPYDNSALQAYIAPNGQYMQVSDARRKQDIRRLDGALTKLGQLSGYTYRYQLAPAEVEKGQQPQVSSGLLAQEIAQVLPEAVEQDAAGNYYVHYAGVLPLLVEALKEEHAQKEALSTQFEQLEQRLRELETRLK